MSEEERQNLNEKGCDDRQSDNVEVGNRTIASDNTVQVSHNTSEITDHNLQHRATEDIEVDPNDVMRVEELSHEAL